MNECACMVFCFAEDGGGGRYRPGWDSMNLQVGWTLGQNPLCSASVPWGLYPSGIVLERRMDAHGT
eukprot:5186271-Pyramimonas_sp.AAC.1